MNKQVMISEADAAQVKAILTTHAEMQDRRTLDGEQIISRLRIEQPNDEDAQEMIDELTLVGAELILDTENLKRIAELF